MILKGRAKFCGFIGIVIAVIIAGKLFYLQTIKHEELSRITHDRVFRTVSQDVLRGSFLDRNGNVLAESIRSYTIAISKKYIKDKDKVFSILETALKGVTKKELNKLWKEKGNFFYIKKAVMPDEYEILKYALQKERITGIEIAPMYTRLRPYNDMAIDLLGYTNSKNMGLSGLELYYNEELVKKIKKKKVKKSRKGNIIYDATADKTEPTIDIHLTIDTDIQYYAEKILNKYTDINEADGGVLLVQDTKTAEILALASNPKTNGQAMAFQWTYEPGSTFKAITFAAALDTNTIKITDSIQCEKEGKWEVTPGVFVRDVHKAEHGYLTVPEVLSESSNIGAGKIALKMDSKDFYEYIKAFGFGIKTAISFPAEPNGILRSWKKWYKIDKATLAFGHGLSVTPIQLITAYTAIANGGTLMQPYIVSKITNHKGRVIEKNKPTKIRKVISPSTAELMKILLIKVVEGGTGVQAKIEGYSTAGKTGTSEKFLQGKYSEKHHTVSFAGFVPAEKPRYTVLVILDNPKTTSYASQSASPAFRDMASAVLNLESVPQDQQVL
ncbi:MAG: penicillin-binding protein 2 [Elusimicrobiaceae bacterium]|jgi:cell division protein FtsI (penicillin-binding protein 3)|nr:penicillin-binding protein 2 [Elusimicrobiaceae bacterium]MBT3954670.1 penicillin-binding protein 2 [Elusimicrobiaceae bacterium]MBT4007856.1 penicillin-binding protein 2 [Elusimicrobiaceae bacterium]MBT4402877.1 penicillin-binding protein 2 [Elusimicrobiaceae bacterium]MBT4440111.1 penicillin-binding protein 2 [Elusimicrobiaceae bacterium]